MADAPTIKVPIKIVKEVIIISSGSLAFPRAAKVDILTNVADAKKNKITVIPAHIPHV